MAKEIYRIKFNQTKTDEGVPKYMQYTLGMQGWIEGELLTPQKIKKVKDRIIVDFAEGIQHNFAFKEDTELFYRDIKKEDADKTTD